jgi:Cdc6-like AAA superfamily ATPase|tara:strand:+ start:81 stop:239 length:159 start_codon:yes stop_codon:yes gene_type:complete
MAKTNLTSKKKEAGTFIRLTTEFKKRAKVYAVENDMTLTDLFINSVEKMMKS